MKAKKKMGRPTKDPAKVKKVLSIYLADVEMRRLESEAERLGLTRSQVVEVMLIKSFYQKFPGGRDVDVE